MTRTLLLAAVLAMLPAGAHAKAAPRRQAAAAGQPLTGRARVVHALNRLGYGPRPGDLEAIRKEGLDRWLQRQLHPEEIPEPAALTAKLAVFDSLAMPPADLAAHYPSDGALKALLDGKLAPPPGPAAEEATEWFLFDYSLRTRQWPNKVVPPVPDLSQLLPPDEQQIFEKGTPGQKLDLFSSYSPERQDALLAFLPAGIRYQLTLQARGPLARRIEMYLGAQQILARDLTEAKLIRAVESPRQLLEVMTDFWFNHFNVFLGKSPFLVTSYERQVIAPKALGNFEDLLKATAQSPAMLVYLDNTLSRAPTATSPGLNENYGRELLELHTLGVDGGYTQQDVREVARCFTGWTVGDPAKGSVFFYNDKIHDKGGKVVLGQQIPAGGGVEDGLAVLHLLAHHPATAHFVSRKLAQRFVADDPPPQLVDRMAAVFLRSGGEIRPVLETMLQSPEFWSQGAFRAKVKSPLEFAASAVRALNGAVESGMPLAGWVQRMGQPLYGKAEPTGYPDRSAAWMTSAAIVERANFAAALGNSQIQGVQAHPESALPADFLNRAHSPGDLPVAGIAPETAEAATRAARAKAAPAYAALLLASPDFQRK